MAGREQTGPLRRFYPMQVLEDLMVALKIVSPNAQNTVCEENKENIQQSATPLDVVDNADKTNDVPMEVEAEAKSHEPASGPSTTGSTVAPPAGPEVEMVSDVDCSISEND